MHNLDAADIAPKLFIYLCHAVRDFVFRIHPSSLLVNQILSPSVLMISQFQPIKRWNGTRFKICMQKAPCLPSLSCLLF